MPSASQLTSVCVGLCVFVSALLNFSVSVYCVCNSSHWPVKMLESLLPTNVLHRLHSLKVLSHTFLIKNNPYL